MYKFCKTEDSAARQRQLEMGLLQALLTQRFEEISVSDLCTQLQVPRKAFYRYFDGKEGALQALLDHILLEYGSFAMERRDEIRWSLQEELETFFLYWMRQQPLLDALQRSGLSNVLVQRAIVQAESGVTTPTRFRADDSEELRHHVAEFGICGLMSMVVRWHREGYPESVEKMAQIALRLLTKPLFL